MIHWLHASILAVAITWGQTGTALSADPAAGRQKAQATCAVCHGIDGIAKIPEAPNLAGESAIYTTRQLKAFKSGERTHQQMSIIARDLSEQDIENLAAWYASLEVTVELPEGLD